MSDLYFLTPEDYAATPPSLAVLTGAEAQHLTRVMRKRVGDEATLFAGDGRALRCEIASIAKGRVELTILETIVDDRLKDRQFDATLRDRRDFATQRATVPGEKRRFVADSFAHNSRKMLRFRSRQHGETRRRRGIILGS